MRTHITRLLALTSVLLGASTAHAAGIFDALGEPGTTTWDTACEETETGVTMEPWIDDPFFECDPAIVPDCMHRVDIDIGAFPYATCNDGSAGAFYIHRGPPNTTRWVIHLQGGGACQSYEECLSRWCGEDEFYTASMMSTDWTADGIADIPDHIALGGMRLQAAANDFADYHHVYVYYCSSDAWVGTEPGVTLSGATSSFEIDARGHSILVAVRHMLRRVGAGANWSAVDGSKLPDLDLATEVLFTGSSAGGFGAVMNVDWFLTPLTNADTALVLDAALEPSDDQVAAMDVWIDNDPVNVGGDVDAVTNRIADIAARWAPGGFLNEIGAFIDESCRAEFEPTGEIDRCIITSELLAAEALGSSAIAADTYVRMDQQDPVLSASWLDGTAVIGSGGTTAVTIDDYRTMIRATLTTLHNLGPVVTGAYSARCNRHVGLEDTKVMGVDITQDYLIIPPTFGASSVLHDALVDWWNGGAIVPNRYIDRGTGASLSTCAP